MVYYIYDGEKDRTIYAISNEEIAKKIYEGFKEIKDDYSLERDINDGIEEFYKNFKYKPFRIEVKFSFENDGLKTEYYAKQILHMFEAKKDIFIDDFFDDFKVIFIVDAKDRDHALTVARNTVAKVVEFIKEVLVKDEIKRIEEILQKKEELNREKKELYGIIEKKIKEKVINYRK